MTSDICYICLEITDESVCGAGCKVHRQCADEFRQRNQNDTCTICKTPYVELEDPEPEGASLPEGTQVASLPEEPCQACTHHIATVCTCAFMMFLVAALLVYEAIVTASVILHVHNVTLF